MLFKFIRSVPDSIKTKCKAFIKKVGGVNSVFCCFIVLNNRYHSFFQTLLLVWKEEGSRGLYGGMTAHQLRVVPNTAIIFFSYEAIVRVLERWDMLSYYNHH